MSILSNADLEHCFEKKIRINISILNKLNKIKYYINEFDGNGFELFS
jgi:hypothetical protein